MKTKALREQRKSILDKMRAMADTIAAENRDLNSEEQASFNAMTQERKTLSARIETIEAAYAADAHDEAREFRAGHHDIDPRNRFTGPTDEQKALALAAWIGHPQGRYPTDAQEMACRAVGIRPDANEITLQLGGTAASKAAQAAFQGGGRNGGDRTARAAAAYRAALSNETTTAGQVLTAPGSMASSLEVNMLAYGGLLQVCDTMTTDTGEEITWPTGDDTSNSGTRIGVNVATVTTPDPTWAGVKWGAHGYSSKAILVPYRLLRDSAFDLPSVIGAMLGERLGRIFNTECTTGTGNSMPWGIVTRADAYSAASATAISADDLIKLKKQVDPAYRAMGCAYMMHDATTLAISLLKDGIGRPLWQDSLSQGEPDRFNGDPVYINQAMDSTISSGKKSVLYGHMPSYKVRRVGAIRLYRNSDLYRISGDQDVFAAFAYLDGNLLTSGTSRMKALTH